MHLQGVVQVPTAAVCHDRVVESARRSRHAQLRQASHLKRRTTGISSGKPRPPTCRQAHRAFHRQPSRPAAASRQEKSAGRDEMVTATGRHCRSHPHQASSTCVQMQMPSAERDMGQIGPTGVEGAAHRSGTRSTKMRAQVPGSRDALHQI